MRPKKVGVLTVGGRFDFASHPPWACVHPVATKISVEVATNPATQRGMHAACLLSDGQIWARRRSIYVTVIAMCPIVGDSPVAMATTANSSCPRQFDASEISRTWPTDSPGLRWKPSPGQDPTRRLSCSSDHSIMFLITQPLGECWTATSNLYDTVALPTLRCSKRINLTSGPCLTALGYLMVTSKRPSLC